MYHNSEAEFLDDLIIDIINEYIGAPEFYVYSNIIVTKDEAENIWKELKTILERQDNYA